MLSAAGRGGRAAEQAWAWRGAGAGGQVGGADDRHCDGGPVNPLRGARLLVSPVFDEKLVRIFTHPNV